MPTYDYLCGTCGPFEARRAHAAAGAPLACPDCGAHARRLFAAPYVRSPAGPLAWASRQERARVERSHSGEPAVTEAAPGGRPVEHALHAHRHRHGPARPWLLGH